MPLIDDLAEDQAPDSRRRRLVLGTVGSTALAAMGLGTLVTGVRYLRPNVLFAPATRFAIGRVTDLARGVVVWLRQKKLYVVRSEQGIYAMTSVCSHLGCMTRYEAGEKSFFCPCHGSRFDLEGRVVAGPAPRPLDRVQVEVERGKVVVDVARKVAPGTVMKV